ncbi:hypothetical protein B4Q13_24840, partial [Lacticaseibacillus rhamnosus]
MAAIGSQIGQFLRRSRRLGCSAEMAGRQTRMRASWGSIPVAVDALRDVGPLTRLRLALGRRRPHIPLGLGLMWRNISMIEQNIRRNAQETALSMI